MNNIFGILVEKKGEPLLSRENKDMLIEPFAVVVDGKEKTRFILSIVDVNQIKDAKIKSKLQRIYNTPKDHKLQPVPRIKSRDTIYVAGPSGSGKSTYVSKYTKKYADIFPNNQIYLFSRVEEDEAFDKLGVIRVKLDQELIEDPLTPEELQDTMVIFDDTDTIQDKSIKDAITHLKNDILETGRHNSITVAITSHLINKSAETRTVINESQNYTFFPQSGSSRNIKYLLREYMGLEMDLINNLMKLPSRWITIKKTCPMMVLYETGCFFLSDYQQ